MQVSAGGVIDYVDIIKNNQLMRRFALCDVEQIIPSSVIRTKLYLELGWGLNHSQVPCEVEFGILEGEILSVEPRFRGEIVVSPLDVTEHPLQCYHSHWEAKNDKIISFATHLRANANYYTSRSQGMCIEVKMPRTGEIITKINGKEQRVALERLIKGSLAGNFVDEMESHCWKLHKAPLPWEFQWDLDFEERPELFRKRDAYYVRVRQTNDQWAWSSPIFVVSK